MTPVTAAVRPRWKLPLLIALGFGVAVLEAVGVYALYLFGIALTSRLGSVPGTSGLAVRLAQRVADAAHTPVILVLGLAVLATTIARSVARIGHERLLVKTQLGVMKRFTMELFTGTFGLRYEAFLRRNSTDRVASMTVEMDRAATAVVSYVRVWSQALTALLVLLLLLVDWRALAFGAAAGGLLFLAMWPIMRAVQGLGREKGPAGRALWNAIAEPVRAFRAVVTFDAQDRMAQELEAQYKGYFRILHRISIRQLLVTPVLEVSLALFLFLGVAVSVAVSSSPEAALPIILLLMVSTYRLLPAMTGLYQVYGAYRFNLPGLERVLADLEENRAWHDPHHARYAELPGGRVLIRMQDVHFAYEGGPEIVRGVDLEVGPGERVAIVGPSGAGKSTVVDLLLSLLKPTRGSVAMARRPDGERVRVAYLPQQSIVLDATVLENLDLGRPKGQIDRARAQRALDVVGLGAGSAHPVELDRPLAEGGVRISGGQRQRLGLARALYREPDLLILDEPTASLDEASEAQLVEALGRIPGLAMIIVTHREAPLRICPRVYRLEQGRLTAVKG
jgi:ABC-type multidrug transport system fused ATPase/permease subunit